MKTGAEVGARRWALHAAHPGCWKTPWRGVLLAVDDPRAWANTARFPSPRPNRAAVRQHVAANIQILSRVPVLWDFGPSGRRVYWETAANLRPYVEDLADWERERAAALAAEGERGDRRAA